MSIFIKDDIEKIYNKYINLVSFVVSKYIKDEEIIKDISHDVFLNYIEQKDKVKDIQKYLTSTAKYISLSYLKEINAIKYETLIEKNNDCNIYTDLSNIRYKLFIDDLRKFLNDEEIDIIIFHIIYDYSLIEISKKLNRNYNSIKSIYHRAINKCKEKGVY